MYRQDVCCVFLPAGHHCVLLLFTFISAQWFVYFTTDVVSAGFAAKATFTLQANGAQIQFFLTV